MYSATFNVEIIKKLLSLAEVKQFFLSNLIKIRRNFIDKVLVVRKQRQKDK